MSEQSSESPSGVDADPAGLAERFAGLAERLAAHGQQHVLRFWDQLDAAGRDSLARQLAEVDLELLDQLVRGEDQSVDFGVLAARAEAPPSVRADGTGAEWSVAEARARGEESLRRGEVAVLIVAGGQGTRLGFDQPKGMFPVGPLSGRTLFQFFADRLKAVARRYGRTVPLYLMTSPATHEETLAYLQANDYLGLGRDDVHVFCQGTMPAVDRESGKLLLAERDSLALSPDGHGGTVAALQRSGALEAMRRRGIRQLFYAQVDNPLVPLADPELIGHHLMAGSEMTTQVVRKRFPMEKVGNVVLVDGRVQIIEYSDLPEQAAEMTDEAGNLKLWAGNIAVHVFELEFLARAADDPQRLPFHRATKKVPYVDERGQRVEPEEPNATKFERFIFDLLPSASHAFVVEGIPAEVFAPVKNADGAPTDTPAAAKGAIVDLHRRWLEQAGVNVAAGVQVEINSQLALDAGEVASAVAEGRLPAAGTTIESDQYFGG
ncbi:UTP--glucose-1-phosphate uridylyltransferase [Candidatus Laterigemmans baculatus]|uniref:UTP--glucose-1-phosphate uridylyltransferase n=1 Tax=Candidatus Laterigemmans baculatus TaxID=2770505 RepID=UPI0013DB7729|nr:UDPGP type 1 family protein [Candidatus Laterigemmans baculatus]